MNEKLLQISQKYKGLYKNSMRRYATKFNNLQEMNKLLEII